MSDESRPPSDSRAGRARSGQGAFDSRAERARSGQGGEPFDSREEPLAQDGRHADSFAPFRRVRVTRVGRGEESAAEDVAATEEPLEVRLHGKPFAVIMRTPGQDRELAAGFLFSEGILMSSEALGAVEHCRHPHHPDVHNIVDVYLMGEAASGLDRHLAERRNVLTNSSCGLCGRVTIDSLLVRAAPLTPGRVVARAVAAALPDALRSRQSVFEETGGLHGAALFDFDGN